MNNNFRQVLVGVVLNGLGHYLHQGNVWCVPVGAMGPLWLWDGGACGLCPKSRVQRTRLAFRGLPCW